MTHFSINRVSQHSNEEINARLKELSAIQDRLEQSMRINRNCHSAVIGTHYEATMIKWTLQSMYHSMDRQYIDALNEEFYLQDVLENRAHDELSSPHEYTTDNPAMDDADDNNWCIPQLNNDDLPF